MINIIIIILILILMILLMCSIINNVYINEIMCMY